MKSKVSVIIPGYNEAKNIPNLIKALSHQTLKPLEVIFVDDCSTDDTVQKIGQHFKTIVLPENRGPAVARNIGMKAAKGDILAFIDADVKPRPDWVEQVQKNLGIDGVNGLVGGVFIPKSTVLGDSIAALGFPGGGNLGTEKMWRIDENDGTTDHISGLNFAIRRSVFQRLGGFDESYEFNGEDAAYGHYLARNGVRLKFIPELAVEHPPIIKLSHFIRWHYKRGIGNFYMKQRLEKVGHLIKLRLWSSMNIIKSYYKNWRFPIIMFLLFLSFVVQQWGYITAKKGDAGHE